MSFWLHSIMNTIIMFQADEPGVPGGVYRDGMSGRVCVHLGPPGQRRRHSGPGGRPRPSHGGTRQPHTVKPGVSHIQFWTSLTNIRVNSMNTTDKRWAYFSRNFSLIAHWYFQGGTGTIVWYEECDTNRPVTHGASRQPRYTQPQHNLVLTCEEEAIPRKFAQYLRMFAL